VSNSLGSFLCQEFIVTHSVPPPSLPSGPQLDHRNLELHCLLLGDDATRILFVEIANTKPVSALKEAIKEKKLSLHHIDADALTLWKVSIPVNDGFKENVRKVQLRDEKALSPVDKLSDVFSDVPARRHVHMLISVTGEYYSFLCCDELESLHDFLLQIRLHTLPQISNNVILCIYM
jgi:Crinkler effector protein N-terminal domain